MLKENNKPQLNREQLEFLLSLKEDHRWQQLEKILRIRLEDKQRKLSEKPLNDSKDLMNFNMLVGSKRELEELIALDQMIREFLLTHSQ